MEEKDFLKPTKRLRISSPKCLKKKRDIEKFQSFWTNSKHLELRDESDNEFQKQPTSMSIEDLVLEEIETKKKEVNVKLKDSWNKNR